MSQCNDWCELTRLVEWNMQLRHALPWYFLISDIELAFESTIGFDVYSSENALFVLNPYVLMSKIQWPWYANILIISYRELPAHKNAISVARILQSTSELAYIMPYVFQYLNQCIFGWLFLMRSGIMKKHEVIWLIILPYRVGERRVWRIVFFVVF